MQDSVLDIQTHHGEVVVGFGAIAVVFHILCDGLYDLLCRLVAATSEESKLLLLDYFNIEGEWTESVITANHRTHRVLHPAVVEVAFASGQRFHKLTHGTPGRRAHPLRAQAVLRYPLLSLRHLTCMFDGVLIVGHQVSIDGLTNGSNPHSVHLVFANIICKDKDKCAIFRVFHQILT